jgi:hypothetical protein
MIDLNRMKELRRKMTTEAQIAEVWRFFLDHFGESEEFVRLGTPLTDTTHPLFTVIAQAAREVLIRNALSERIADAVVLENSALISVPEHRIIHGPLLVEGYPAAVLYLDDIQMGALHMFVKPNYSEYVRFTVAKAPGQSARRN